MVVRPSQVPVAPRPRPAGGFHAAPVALNFFSHNRDESSGEYSLNFHEHNDAE